MSHDLSHSHQIESFAKYSSQNIEQVTLRKYPYCDFNTHAVVICKFIDVHICGDVQV